MALLTGKLEDMTEKRGRERGSDTQQRDPGRKSNPGPLQSLGTWGAHSTNWATRRPLIFILMFESLSMEAW